MKEQKKSYWKGIEQLSNDPEFVKYADREFPEYLPVNGNDESGQSNRRDFLKMMGFSLAAASLAACEAPVRKAIPYLNKPVDVDPGIPNYYASTFADGQEYCSIVVKTREGRPIKIEGNSHSKISGGGTSARVEASVLSLYDKQRFSGPQIDGAAASWEDVDKEVGAKLSEISASGGKILIISNTILSPTTQKAIDEFTARYGNVSHVTYDTQSVSGISKANAASFGKSAIPSYDFSKAKVIVSFGADFLGSWISPLEFSRQYGKTRKVKKEDPTMSRHFQFESNMSLSGANADYRTPIKASQQGLAVATLYNLIASKAGATSLNVSAIEGVAHLEKAADELWANRGESLVVSGSNDTSVQIAVNAINDLLGNYGGTIDLDNPVNYRKGDDEAINDAIGEINAGQVSGVIFYNCNPVYNHPMGSSLASSLANVSLTVSTSDRKDETSDAVAVVAPDHHYLESWNDAEPRGGHYSMTQPVIRPLFNTRQAQESLLKWAGNDTKYYDYLRENWSSNQFAAQSEILDFGIFWDTLVHNGVYAGPAGTQEESADETADTSVETTSSFSADFSAVANSISSTYSAGNPGVELVLYYKVGIGDGSHANNPWLQEMPDPVTKATWENYLTVSQRFANSNGIVFKEGMSSTAVLKAGGQEMTLPVVVQPGQADGTVGLALGYGRSNAGRVGNDVGVDATPLLALADGTLRFDVTEGVSVEVTGELYRVAQTQTHQTYMGRETVIQEAKLADYKEDPSAGRYQPHVATWKSDDKSVRPGALSLWKGHEYPNHHWGMVIDMNSCIGCGACTIACQVENNVPVVGRDEVLMRREMHWIRIDRYYSSDAPEENRRALEIASENPEITFQPIMCQHCNNAPCETVCPVAATTHSTEGLNQMAYNRCIGTRYCANNCPYKVRRFNWFKYHDNAQFADPNFPMNDDMAKMVLNPDVTVRSRGVMEKCTLCVQRIQYGKLEAKKEGRRTNDSDVNTACAASCPTEAIVFGDMKDHDSRIYKMLKIQESAAHDEHGEGGKEHGVDVSVGEERAYHVLEEIGVKPNVFYLTKIRNKDKEA